MTADEKAARIERETQRSRERTARMQLRAAQLGFATVSLGALVTLLELASKMV